MRPVQSGENFSFFICALSDFITIVLHTFKPTSAIIQKTGSIRDDNFNIT